MIAPVQTLQKGRHPDWQSVYRDVAPATLPWYAADLDPDIGRALRLYGPAGATLLDLGCGTGEQASAMAALGFKVRGIDLAEAAIAMAKTRATSNLAFEVADVLRINVAAPFDVAVDRGLFHVLEPLDRAGYAAAVAAALAPGGILLLKCFRLTTQDPGVGPWPFTLSELSPIFDERFVWVERSATEFAGPRPQKPAAWLCVLKRRN